MEKENIQNNDSFSDIEFNPVEITEVDYTFNRLKEIFEEEDNRILDLSYNGGRRGKSKWAPSNVRKEDIIILNDEDANGLRNILDQERILPQGFNLQSFSMCVGKKFNRTSFDYHDISIDLDNVKFSLNRNNYPRLESSNIREISRFTLYYGLRRLIGIYRSEVPMEYKKYYISGLITSESFGSDYEHRRKGFSEGYNYLDKRTNLIDAVVSNNEYLREKCERKIFNNFDLKLLNWTSQVLRGRISKE